ncbi:MAG: hypothetical protein VX252_07935 [Myxococcota bacterium]|nr:hypothetical protein [Myxococcota bacterium]
MSFMKRRDHLVGRGQIWLLALVLLACGGAENQDATPRTPSAKPASTETAAVKPTAGVPMIEEGAQKVPIAETAEGPARYPEDGPDCPGCSVTGTWIDDTGRTHRTWTSTASGDTLQKNMLDQLKKNGWEIRSNLKQSGQYALDATKNGGRIAILIASDPKTRNNLISAILTP